MSATLARGAVEWGESLRGVLILSRHLASVQKFSPGARHSHNISESAKLTMHTNFLTGFQVESQYSVRRDLSL